MKSTFCITALVALLGFALASTPLTVSAETTAPAPAAKTKAAKAPTASGTITAIDATANTVTIQTTKKQGDKSESFTVTSTTKIKKDKKAATLADFAVGDKVTIGYTEAAGVMTATSLYPSGGKPSKKDKAAAAAPASAPAPAAAPAAQ